MAVGVEIEVIVVGVGRSGDGAFKPGAGAGGLVLRRLAFVKNEGRRGRRFCDFGRFCSGGVE